MVGLSGAAGVKAFAMMSAAVNALKFKYDKAEPVKVTRRAVPQVGFKWEGQGPRPNHTFRAARRADGRKHYANFWKQQREHRGLSRSDFDRLRFAGR